MNLVIFISSLSSGGAERVTANLADYWATKGWQVTVVTLADRDLDFYRLLPSVRLIGLRLLRESPNVLLGIFNTLKRVLALRRVLKAIGPDVVLAMMDKNNILLALAGLGLSNLVIIGSEHIHPPQYPWGTLWEFLRRHLYARLDAVVALTETSAAWLRQHTSARRVPVIPNAVPYPLPSQPPRVEPPSKAPRQSRLLLAVGRLCDQKGFDLLLAAFQKLARHFPDWLLVILGDGPLRGELTRQIMTAGLQDRVLLPGRAGNMGEWYEAADLFVLSSRYEGFPNVLVEAMAHGLPAVSFDCDTGPRDIIRHEVDGLLVPPGNADALAQALGCLMQDEQLRQRYASRAFEVRERFSMGRVAGMWENLFDELLRARGR